jgi:hypothetical protein
MYSKPVRTLLMVLLLAAVGYALTGCGPSDHQSIFDVKGPVADKELSITMITRRSPRRRMETRFSRWC